MTTTSQAGPARRTPLVIGAVVVAVVATVVILVWGLVPLPGFTPASDPGAFEIPGTIAFLTTDQDTTCVTIAGQTAPQPRELACYLGEGRGYAEQVGWTDDGRVVVTLYGPTGPRYEVLDRSSGDVLLSGAWDQGAIGKEPMPEPPASATDVSVRQTAGRVVVTTRTEGQTITLIDVEAPASYTFWEQHWSPDRAFLLLLDSEQRIVVVPADGSADAVLVAQDARSAAWWMPEVGASDPVVLPDAA